MQVKYPAVVTRRCDETKKDTKSFSVVVPRELAPKTDYYAMMSRVEFKAIRRSSALCPTWAM